MTDDEREDYFAEMAVRFRYDPKGFVLWAFDWKHGDLSGEDGLDDWQVEYLGLLGDELEERGFDGVHAVLPVLMAVGSGHGVGKSALVAWIILFLMFTRPFCRGAVTASTVTQLSTKTVPELAKWHQRFIARHWFVCDAMKIVHTEHPKTWRTDFLTAKKENSEAFAGQHQAQSSSFYIFDESSGVPDEINEVAMGGLTDGEPLFLKFGNRTKPLGHFQRCFTTEAHRWITMVVDSRKAKKTNKALLQRWIEDYGIDSDFCRVRILGLAPSEAAEQFIPLDLITAARHRLLVHRDVLQAPLVMGVDVARYGGHRSVVAFRKGRDARTHPAKIYRQISTMDLADNISADIRELHPVRVLVDGGGIGGAVVDRLHSLGHGEVIEEVNFGGASASREFFNARAFMWGQLRNMLKYLAIEDSDELQEDLLCQEYLIDPRTRTTRLVAKEDMHSQGLLSPDWGDALALTCVHEYAEAIQRYSGMTAEGLSKVKAEYNPYGSVEG